MCRGRLRILALGTVLAWAWPVAAGADALLDPVGDTPPAPALSLPVLDGGAIDIGALRGRVVLVNFWATWCAPCRDEMPSLERLRQQLAGDDFEVLAVDVGESREDVRRFLDSLDTPLSLPILLDEDTAVTQQWAVIGLPTTYVVTREGRLEYQALGERDWSSNEMRERIQAIIDAKEDVAPRAAVLAATGVLLAALGIAGAMAWRWRDDQR